MSKFFYRGTPDIMGNYGKNGYNPKPNIKLGSADNPLTLTVCSEAREAVIIEQVNELGLVANIEVTDKKEENLLELEAVLNKPKTQTFDKTPKRNDPCSCGSGKKYKKCCG